MKKIALPSMIILIIMYIGFLPARAMDFTVDIGSISTLGDIGYGLAGGASFNFNNSKYKIDNYDVMSTVEQAAALNAAAEQWLSDYAALRVPTMYMTTEYRKMVETANRNYWRANGDVAAERAALRLGLTPTIFSSWAGYNEFWAQKYIDSLHAEAETTPTYPDEDYLNYLDLINDSSVPDGFFWKYFLNPVTGTGDYNMQLVNGNWFDYTWVVTNNRNNIIYQNRTTSILGAELANINITSSNGTYYWSQTFTRKALFNSIYKPNGSIVDRNFPYDVVLNKSGTLNDFSGSSLNSTVSFSTSGTLAAVLQYVSNHVRNANIYVDGVPWDLVNDIPLNPVIPDFEDVIVTPNDEEIYPDIIMPDTDYGGFDLTSIFDAIKEAIADASSDDVAAGDGILDIDDVLNNDGVIDINDGTAVDTIDVPFPDTIPIEIEDINPPFPVFPIEVEPIHNAFSGTTILAELVDATQIVLPDELILVFWGIVFILFIIGLIKIFHK